MRPLQDIEQLPATLIIEEIDSLEENEKGIDLEIEGLNKTHYIEEKEEKPIKPHILRRNVEDYLEKKALERRLQDVFDSDYLFD